MNNNTAIIITIGDELLIGQTIDTNSPWIAKELNKLGIHVVRRLAIADEAAAITTTLDACIPETNLIIITGGLGPTSDDITKPTLSKYFGGALKRNETVLKQIQELYDKRQRPYHKESIEQQSEVPDYCAILMNRIGTAPGMWFEKKDCVVISLPGVPFEMQHIMEQEALPRLRSRHQSNHIIHHTIITAGIGETAIADKIKQVEQQLPPNIHLAYLPSPGIVKLRLTTEGKDEYSLLSEVKIQARKIVMRLGDYVMAQEDKDMEAILVELLWAKRKKLALAESCTGGYLAHRITNIPGSSKVFKGGYVTYANQAKNQLLGVSKKTLKIEGAVSKTTVLQMAEQARKSFNTDIALSISGVLGPGGATKKKPVGLVWMAVSIKGKKPTAYRFQFHYGRIQNKEIAANMALSLLINELRND